MSKIRTENTVANFNKKLQKVFDIYGVEKIEGDNYRFKVNTVYGTLLIHPHNPADKGGLWTIFMRFDTDWKQEECVKKIGESTSLNTYSGKWNIHQLESDDAIEMFKYKMQLVKL